MRPRAARLGDLHAIARVHWLASNLAHGRNDDYSRSLASTTHALSLTSVRSFVVEDDGDVVGVTHVGKDELYALYVHPGYWGTGEGQALIEQAHGALAETCEEARLTVLEANGRARRFFERNGWELSDQLIEVHFRDEPAEVCRYSKRFSSSRSPS